MFFNQVVWGSKHLPGSRKLETPLHKWKKALRLGLHLRPRGFPRQKFELNESMNLNNGKRKPKRSNYNNAHAYLAAPYGIYKTSDGYIAISMTPVPKLGELLDLESIQKYTNQEEWFTKRDEIKKLIGDFISTKTTQYLLDILQPADVWCSEVLEWDKMIEHEGFKVIDMLQRIKRYDGLDIETLRCPLRFNSNILKSEIAAPIIGQHTDKIKEEFFL